VSFDSLCILLDKAFLEWLATEGMHATIRTVRGELQRLRYVLFISSLRLATTPAQGASRCGNDLAMLLKNTVCSDGANLCGRQALAIATRALCSHHPTTKQLGKNRAWRRKRSTESIRGRVLSVVPDTESMVLCYPLPHLLWYQSQ
jgi:hypothetical protein